MNNQQKAIIFIHGNNKQKIVQDQSKQYTKHTPNNKESLENIN